MLMPFELSVYHEKEDLKALMGYDYRLFGMEGVLRWRYDRHYGSKKNGLGYKYHTIVRDGMDYILQVDLMGVSNLLGKKRGLSLVLHRGGSVSLLLVGKARATVIE